MIGAPNRKRANATKPSGGFSLDGFVVLSKRISGGDLLSHG